MKRSYGFTLFQRIAMVVLLTVLGGCVMVPESFQLYDSNQQHWQGTIYPGHERMEVRINGQHYQGFYIISHGTAVTSTPEVLFGFPPIMNNMVDISMNNARASLVATDGTHLSCTFLFQGKRLLGECSGSNGAHYQLVAGESQSNHSKDDDAGNDQ